MIELLAQGTPLSETGEWIVSIFFYLMALVGVVAALKMVTTDNVVHAALYLLVVLSVVAGTYIILGAEFAAATQILVYLGAIMVLLLFGVMLTRTQIGSDADLDHDQKWLGGLVSLGMLLILSFSIWEFFGEVSLPRDRQPQRTSEVAVEIFSTYIVAFEALSVLLLAALIGAVVIARKD